jgi:hypothetical protein
MLLVAHNYQAITDHVLPVHLFITGVLHQTHVLEHQLQPVKTLSQTHITVLLI